MRPLTSNFALDLFGRSGLGKKERSSETSSHLCLAEEDGERKMGSWALRRNAVVGPLRHGQIRAEKFRLDGGSHIQSARLLMPPVTIYCPLTFSPLQIWRLYFAPVLTNDDKDCAQSFERTIVFFLTSMCRVGSSFLPSCLPRNTGSLLLLGSKRMLESPDRQPPSRQHHRPATHRKSAMVSVVTPSPSRPPKSRPPRTTPKRWAAAAQPVAISTGAAAASTAAASSSAQRQHNQQHDQPSVGNESTPSSVLVHRIPLTRDLSDLSGSYAGRTCVSGASSTAIQPRQHPLGEKAGGNGKNGSPSRKAAGQTLVLASHKDWTQARVLSPREPHHPQPQSSGDSVSVAVRRRGGGGGATVPPGTGRTANGVGATDTGGDSGATKPFLVVEPTAVELIENMEVGNDQRRIPLIILLMDPARCVFACFRYISIVCGRAYAAHNWFLTFHPSAYHCSNHSKLYELAQLWVDQVEDSVRDVLHAIQHHLRDKQNWKTDYDGLFQYRNQSYSQLIHILDVNRYDAQPYELWIAKPWSMSAKATIGHAAGAIQHLRDINVLRQESSATKHRDGSNNGLGAHGSAAVVHGVESLLVLSREARARIYAPDGVLKHYHACQFLSFSPALESQHPVPTNTIRVDVLGTDAYSEDGCSQLSDSHYYAASVSHDEGTGDGGGGGGFSVHSGSSSNRALLSGSQACSGPSTLPSTPSLTRTLSRNHHVTSSSKLKQGSTSKKEDVNRNSKSQKDLELHPHKSQSTSRGVNAWSLLSCAGCKRDAPEDSKTVTDPTLLDATTVGPMMLMGGPTWRAAWEEELSVVNSVAPSVQSERAPLLQNLGATGSRGWRFEI